MKFSRIFMWALASILISSNSYCQKVRFQDIKGIWCDVSKENGEGFEFINDSVFVVNIKYDSLEMAHFKGMYNMDNSLNITQLIIKREETNEKGFFIIKIVNDTLKMQEYYPRALKRDVRNKEVLTWNDKVDIMNTACLVRPNPLKSNK